jgi:hypothetical protein
MLLCACACLEDTRDREKRMHLHIMSSTSFEPKESTANEKTSGFRILRGLMID